MTVETHSFTRAARRLGLQQSTVSQHVSRLESHVGRRLLARDTHDVELTKDGQTMLELATSILAQYERLQVIYKPKRLSGRIRLGATEDFAVNKLSTILFIFKRIHEMVDVELTIAPSQILLQQIEGGLLDLAVTEQVVSQTKGTYLCREKVHWYGAGELRRDGNGRIPLVLYEAPSLIRDLAIEACEAAGIAWHLACSSCSYLGLRAAVLAGLGVTALGENVRSQTLDLLPVSAGLPALANIERIISPSNAQGVIGELANAIIENERGGLEN